MTTTEQLAALKAAAERATPGPYEVVENEGWDEAYCDWHRVGPHSFMGGTLTKDSTFVLLANPQAVLDLIADNERLTALCIRARELSDWSPDNAMNRSHIMAQLDALNSDGGA